MYSREVPASFETVLICRTINSGREPLGVKWAADNGTVSCDGESIRWIAPSDPGEYGISVKVIDANDGEASNKVNVKVIPRSNSPVDLSPELVLQIPIWGSNAACDVKAVRPATTAVISCMPPLAMINEYKYTWVCNGGKLQGAGIKEGTASQVGWIAPGIPGFYTVTVQIEGNNGNFYAGYAYFNVISPSCCGSGVCEID